ncbi:MAG: hypothetical protein GAK28_01207 [Luteibacter sp.]|uniref:hypothetical protein n=1 Tax=Luteibacter sp. TaxID=1886636 RepID=UPI0013826402|nr:MAG: hypothetical protein GAK28_01207 [Luteibacter sp.]
MNGIVGIALRRPLTIVAMMAVIMLGGSLALVRLPVDIFPHIGVPVVAAAW